MAGNKEIWRPGSFTKNFSWGSSRGLYELYKVIRLGFNDNAVDVPREIFRKRVKQADRPYYIPLNFFLFNKPTSNGNYVLADELVFQAVNSDHSARFDKLALFAFNFSFVGRWTRSTPDQRRPALWANAYVKERISDQLNWLTDNVNADDIERFISADERYRGKTTRKVATNLNFLYSIGGISDFNTKNIDRWWVDALFLALDRIIADRALDRTVTFEADYEKHLSKFNFLPLTGGASLEKEIALSHLIVLYIACGGPQRFDDQKVWERTKEILEDAEYFLANDPRPRGAVDPTNPRVIKSIPSTCAMLAKYAGFEVLDPDEMASFDIEHFIRRGTQKAVDEMRRLGIRPTMTAGDLMRLTRGK